MKAKKFNEEVEKDGTIAGHLALSQTGMRTSDITASTTEPLIERALPVHVQIERHLRRRIASGALKPGDRLPPALELARQFGVHVITMQKVLGRMKLMGLIQRTPRRGTFVKSAREQAQIGIVFGPRLADEPMHAYRSLLKELHKALPPSRWFCRDYDGFNLPKSECINRTVILDRLKGEASQQAFNGLLFCGVYPTYAKRCGAGFHCPIASYYNTSSGMDVCSDYYHFGRESVAFFARQNKRRIVYLRTIPTCLVSNSDIEGCQAACREFGTASFHIEQFPPLTVRYHEQRAFEFTQALIRKWRRSRQWPDAVMISDDIAMRGLGHALTAGGNGNAEKMAVLTWANEGIRFFYGVPVVRYVVSMAEVAQRLIEVLSRRLEGRKPRGLPIKIRGRIEEDGAGRNQRAG